jgi:hypothetical protein
LPVRESAARAYVDVAKSANPAAEVRRLLWEQPDTALEELALRAGQRALPRVWKALAAGSTDERRAASALLAWYPDVASIPHILAVLDSAPGARTRNQLLFDLSMILASVGDTTDAESQRTLAAAHLRWLFDLPAREHRSWPQLRVSGPHRDVAIYPDHVPVPFSVTLGAAKATRLESSEDYLAATRTGGIGLVFHAIRVAHGVARVATTFTQGGFGYQTWVSLYRYDGTKWIGLDVPDYAGPPWKAPSNLVPSFHRNYGPHAPLRVVWLDNVMTHVRIDINARDRLRQVSVDVPSRASAIDASYAPLLDRYAQSDSASVRYVAASTQARLTGKPDLRFWLEALAKETDTRFLSLAMDAISTGVLGPIDREAPLRDASAVRALAAAAIAPEPVNSALLPQRLPAAENVLRARRSGSFALVDVVFGRFDGSGYSMLFERRGDRWVFLFATRGWIA